jgi:hypothetical protein
MRWWNMRRTRRRLLALLILAAVAGGAMAFYFKYVDTSYTHAFFFADTALKGDTSLVQDPIRDRLPATPGRVVLAVTRGERDGIGLVTADHSWHEAILIDIPTPFGGEHIDLSDPDVRITFECHDRWENVWTAIAIGGVRGHLDIKSVGASRISAEYEVIVDIEDWNSTMDQKRHRDVVFRGRSTFRERPRLTPTPPLNPW